MFRKKRILGGIFVFTGSIATGVGKKSNRFSCSSGFYSRTIFMQLSLL